MTNLRTEKRAQLTDEIKNVVLNLYIEGYTWKEIQTRMGYGSPSSVRYYVRHFTPEQKRSHMIALYTRKYNKEVELKKSGQNTTNQ